MTQQETPKQAAERIYPYTPPPTHTGKNNGDSYEMAKCLAIVKLRSAYIKGAKDWGAEVDSGN